MRYYRSQEVDGSHLLVERDGEYFDLTTADREVRSFYELANAARLSDASVDEIAERAISSAPVTSLNPAQLTVPFEAQEVWAAGVTYQRSEEAREEESGGIQFYNAVYDHPRPEIFLKATPGRTVGPGDTVGIREDSTWDVPEPELGLVICDGELVAYTAGNDMSSRSIEGENPLYLPQAKVYAKSCAIGPSIASKATIPDPHDVTIRMEITRDGESVYTDSTATSSMKRQCEELVSYLTRHNTLPERVVLLTGTGLVPPSDFTLQEGDRVDIEVESIGTLTNSVVTV